MPAERGLDQATRPLARIRRAGAPGTPLGTVVGAGFLVGERYVMTCAHVVDDALGRRRGTAERPAEPVVLDLPFLASPAFGLSATVVAWQPMRGLDELAQHPASDVAVLELAKPLTGGVDPAKARLWRSPSGTAVVTFGFPIGLDNAASAEGELGMTDAGNWRHVHDVPGSGYFIEPGFSGAPVFERNSRALIGMVTQADRDATKELAFVIPTVTLGQAWPLLVQPYKGLFAFAEEDHELFFGREPFIDELARKVENRVFLTVIGPSGSGKSSVVMAGLVPRLRAQDGWAVAVCRPGRSPLRLLAHAIEELSGPDPEGSISSRTATLEEQLRRNPAWILDRVALICEGLPDVERVLLIVDQFEELFTQGDLRDGGQEASAETSARQQEFVAVLDAIGRQPDLQARLRVIATLRADFTGRALEDRALADLMRDADVKLGPMTSEELEQAIKRPAARFGVSYEPDDLVPQIVREVSAMAGGLPLLQFALERLWQRQTNQRLTRDAYEHVGRVEGALTERANAVFSQLKIEEQAAAQRVLTRLVRLAAPGEQGEDTRRVVTRHEVGEADWAAILLLAQQRLVTTGQDPATGAETAEIVHEALIRSWPTLTTWLKPQEERRFHHWRQGLMSDVAQFQEAEDEKKKDVLLRGTVLSEAQGWLVARREDLNEQERAFIETSERQHQKDLADATNKAKRSRNLWMLASFIAVIAFIIMLALSRETLNATRREADTKENAAYDRGLRTNAEEAVEQHILSIGAAAHENQGRRLAMEARLLVDPDQPDDEQMQLRPTNGDQLEKPAPSSYELLTSFFLDFPFASSFTDGDDLMSFAEYHSPFGSISAFVVDEGRTIVAVGNNDGRVQVYHAAGASIVMRRYLDLSTLAEIEIEALALSPATDALAVSGSDGSIYLMRPDNPNFVMFERDVLVSGIEEDIEVMTFSSTGQNLATKGDGTVRLFAMPSKQMLAHISYDEQIQTVTFSPDGSRLLVVTDSGEVNLLHASTGELLLASERLAQDSVFAFAPIDGELAFGSLDGVVYLVESSGAVATLGQEQSPINVITFNEEGTVVAYGTLDGTVRLLETRNGAEVLSLSGDSAVIALKLNHAGARLSVGFEDGSTRIVDVLTKVDIVSWDAD